MLTRCWSNLASQGASSLSVTATITLAEDGSIRWRLALTGISEAWRLDSVRFPRLVGLALPSGIGRLIREPRQWLAGADRHRWLGVYPGGLSMQCMALYAADGPGVYLATDDLSRLAGLGTDRERASVAIGRGFSQTSTRARGERVGPGNSATWGADHRVDSELALT